MNQYYGVTFDEEIPVDSITACSMFCKVSRVTVNTVVFPVLLKVLMSGY
jgi:hypothetical protein